MRKLYRDVTGIARAVLRDAERVLQRVGAEELSRLSCAEKLKVKGFNARIQETIALTKRVVVQTKDGGFASTSNEMVAGNLGVKRVALPRYGRLSPARRTHQKQRWFRRALRWRTGSEGRISALKRRHGLRRCRYRGFTGMQRWVGFGVIANNVWILGRT